MKFYTYGVFILLLSLFSSSSFSRTIFDVDAALEGRENLIKDLRESHRRYFIKSFEHNLRHQQKLLKMQLKFVDDLSTELEHMPLENKRDFNKITRQHNKLLKEFEKTTKRRIKFYEKDLVKPLEKTYEKETKDLVKEYKNKSRDWKVKE